jgi:hypothetical protein
VLLCFLVARKFFQWIPTVHVDEISMNLLHAGSVCLGKSATKSEFNNMKSLWPQNESAYEQHRRSNNSWQQNTEYPNTNEE